MSKPRRFDWLFRPQMADEDLPLWAEAQFAEAMAQLPAVERSALALSEIGGLDTFEIAERLGTDPAVVRKLLARARDSVRTSLAVRGRRGLSAFLPLQSWWQTSTSAPVVRAAGIVAAAVVAPTVAIGGAAAERPRATVPAPELLHVRTLGAADRSALVAGRPRVAQAGSAVTRRDKSIVVEKPRSIHHRQTTPPVAGDVGVAPAPPAQPPEPAREQSPKPPASEEEPVGATIPLPAVPETPTVLPPPVDLPAVLPPLPELPPVPAPPLP